MKALQNMPEFVTSSLPFGEVKNRAISFYVLIFSLLFLLRKYIYMYNFYRILYYVIWIVCWIYLIVVCENGSFNKSLIKHIILYIVFIWSNDLKNGSTELNKIRNVYSLLAGLTHRICYISDICLVLCSYVNAVDVRGNS